jgi:hypothetical protein
MSAQVTHVTRRARRASHAGVPEGVHSVAVSEYPVTHVTHVTGLFKELVDGPLTLWPAPLRQPGESWGVRVTCHMSHMPTPGGCRPEAWATMPVPPIGRVAVAWRGAPLGMGARTPSIRCEAGPAPRAKGLDGLHGGDGRTQKGRRPPADIVSAGPIGKSCLTLMAYGEFEAATTGHLLGLKGHSAQAPATLAGNNSLLRLGNWPGDQGPCPHGGLNRIPPVLPGGFDHTVPLPESETKNDSHRAGASHARRVP